MQRQSLLQLPPLDRQKMAELTAKAKDLGITPEHFARQLIEDGLDLRKEAESRTFAEIMGPVRKVAGEISELELAKLVNQARSEHHRKTARGKKR
jgi:hypothetical protein